MHTGNGTGEAVGEVGHAESLATRRHWLHRLAEPQVMFPILAIVTLGMLWFTTLNLARVELDNAQETAQATTQEQLETYEAQVVRVLREIDQTLKSLQYAFQSRGDERAALADLRERDLLPPDLVYTVSLANHAGRIVASTRGSSLSTMLERGLIEQSAVADVFTEWPAVQSEGEWWLRFVRRLTTADGRTGGVALVEVNASFFVSGYESEKLGVSGLLAILGTDGVFRARRTGEDVVIGGHVDYDSLVRGHGFGDAEAVLAANSWDGVSRYTSARELFGFPFAVVVGLSEEEQLTPTLRRTRSYVMRAAIGSILLILALATLARMSWNLEDLRRRERESRVAHARRVEHLAYHDGLTGLPNRSLLSRILDDRISQSGRYGRKFALLFLDLDGFKEINDTLGHDAGDDLLREVARRLEDTLRRSDTVARMGGDEFMILLPELESDAQAGVVAKKILSTLAEAFVLLGEKYSITVSVGISIFPHDGGDEQTLMKHADIAMYAAKDAGKNNFRYFSEEMSVASQERINLESSLRKALLNDEFELYYQARRDLHSGAVTGMEALLRWNHPEYGTVGPTRFLPLAEETGLILPIGRWVLRTACQQVLAWHAEGLHQLNIAVNLSARQFFDRSLTDDVEAILQETGLNPGLLELEISESVLARDTSKTLPVLEQLRKLGLKITVDNFGTGYSALSGLGQLPLDSIKIDRLFMRADAGDTATRDVISGIMAMGRALSPSVIAHGVETKEQVEFLREQLCDQVQGYFFGRPFRAADAAAMLHAEDLLVSGAVSTG